MYGILHVVELASFWEFVESSELLPYNLPYLARWRSSQHSQSTNTPNLASRPRPRGPIQDCQAIAHPRAICSLLPNTVNHCKTLSASQRLPPNMLVHHRDTIRVSWSHRPQPVTLQPSSTQPSHLNQPGSSGATTSPKCAGTIPTRMIATQLAFPCFLVPNVCAESNARGVRSFGSTVSASFVICAPTVGPSG